MAITCDLDIVKARQRGREAAAALGFSSVDQAFVATAISELARNIVLYAGRGEILLRAENHVKSGACLTVEARDSGPGIRNLHRALQGGYSTSGSLGLGLSGVRRLMDEMEIESEPGKGTTVVARKRRR